MPATFWTFLVGTLALAGIPPLSGFYSKDSILGQAFGQHNYILFATAVFVALLTAFYMFRLVFVVFCGKSRTDEASHAHESPGVIAWPLRILALLSIFGGVIGIEGLYQNFFGVDVEKESFVEKLIAPFAHAPVAALCGIGVALVGILAAWKMYAGVDKDPLPEKLGGLSRAMRNRFYFDEIYDATFIRLHNAVAAIADAVDWCIENIFIGLVRGGTDFAGRALRLLQTGNLQHYAFLFALGAALVLYMVLGK